MQCLFVDLPRPAESRRRSLYLRLDFGRDPTAPLSSPARPVSHPRSPWQTAGCKRENAICVPTRPVAAWPAVTNTRFRWPNRINTGRYPGWISAEGKSAMTSNALSALPQGAALFPVQNSRAAIPNGRGRAGMPAPRPSPQLVGANRPQSGVACFPVDPRRAVPRMEMPPFEPPGLTGAIRSGSSWAISAAKIGRLPRGKTGAPAAMMTMLHPDGGESRKGRNFPHPGRPRLPAVSHRAA